MAIVGNGFQEKEATRMTLEIEHPDCWTLIATKQTDCGLIAHTVYNSSGDAVKGHFTAYADNTEEIERLVEIARDLDLTESVVVMKKRHDFTSQRSSLGNTTRELFVKYNPQNSMSDALLSMGFMHDAPVRVYDGKEYWPVFVTADRKSVRRRLDFLREEKSAEITVTKIMSEPEFGANGTADSVRLSKRQREVFLLAKDMGYYSWPRETTTREMADELEVTKTTLLEHLRKAESKLLGAANVK
jgi:predicted DNA binding protein